MAFTGIWNNNKWLDTRVIYSAENSLHTNMQQSRYNRNEKIKCAYNSWTISAGLYCFAVSVGLPCPDCRKITIREAKSNLHEG